MILSNREAQALIAQDRIGLYPCPSARDKRWSPTTVDLTLDAEVTPWEPIDEGNGDEGEASAETVVRPGARRFSVDRLIARHARLADCTSGFILRPGQFVLGWTVERLRLPYQSRIAARVEGKSSLARIGLGVHVTAPVIHPGFGEKVSLAGERGSPIRLEIWNVGPLKIQLLKGMAICQLLFEEVHGTPSQGYSGQFQGQAPSAPPSPPDLSGPTARRKKPSR